MLENKCHINVSELKAATFEILTFTRMHSSVKWIYLQLDYVVALSYLIKMAGTYNKTLSEKGKRFGTTYWAMGFNIF